MVCGCRMAVSPQTGVRPRHVTIVWSNLVASQAVLPEQLRPCLGSRTLRDIRWKASIRLVLKSKGAAGREHDGHRAPRMVRGIRAKISGEPPIRCINDGQRRRAITGVEAALSEKTESLPVLSNVYQAAVTKRLVPVSDPNRISTPSPPCAGSKLPQNC